MKTTAKANIEDLYKLPDTVKAEIVNDEIVLMPLALKRTDYFAAGTLVVWDVDLLGKAVVRVYRASKPKNPTIYRRGDIAEAEPAVPGWKMAANDLFEENGSLDDAD